MLAEDAPASKSRIWGFPKIEVPSWGPYNLDYDILGSILGLPILGNYHIISSGNPL